MTLYEINYHARLDEMIKLITENYGQNHIKTATFNQYVAQRRHLACYQHREDLEQIFKNYMKNTPRGRA